MNKINLSQELPDVVNVLNSKLSQWEKDHQQKYKASLSDHDALDMLDVKKSMKDLGYIQ